MDERLSMNHDQEIDAIIEDVYLRPIRVAQFGGRGGGASSWAPGANSPRGNSGGGHSVNQFVIDEGLDAVMQRTHRPPDPDPERNMEKRMEHMHVHAEEESIPYDLSFEERQRLKIRQQIRRRERFLEEAAQSIDQNSVQYIKDNFGPKTEHITALEEALDARRNNEEKIDPRSKYEDDIWPQERPTRRHLVSQVKSTPTSTVFDNITEEQNPHPFGGEKNRLTRPYGNYDMPIKNSDLGNLDQMNSDWGKDLDGTGASGPHERTLAFDYPMYDNVSVVTPGKEAPPQTPPSAVQDEDSALDTFLTTEEKLNSTKRAPSPKRLQDTPDKGFSIPDYLGNDPASSFDHYGPSDPSGRMFPRTR